jgi:fatty acid desaturase
MKEMRDNPETPSPSALQLYAKPSALRFLLAAGFDWACMIGAILLASAVDHWLTLLFAVFVVGSRQHALTLLGHEGAHFNISRHNRALNDWITCLVVMWPTFAPLDGYRKFHWGHHKFLGTNQDPERGHRALHPSDWSLPASRMRILALCCRDLLGGGLFELARLMKAMPAVSWGDRLGPPILWAAAAGVLWHFGQLWIMGVWVGAYVTVFLALFRLRIWTEHLGIDDLGTSGSYLLTANWFERFTVFPHYTWLHYEHHRWPAIPCWHLTKVRSLMVKATPVTLGELLSGFESGSYPSEAMNALRAQARS